MHFYDFNIGDYAKKTPHLSNEEDLAYRRALDMYYDTEQPLPITHGLATLSRRLRVSEIALQNVINEFFPNGRNKHADEKIAAYYAYLTKQKENGKRGGRPKNQQVTEIWKPTANPVVSQNNPVPSQLLTTNPLTTNQEPIKEKEICAKAPRFIKPSLEEIKAHMSEKGYRFNADVFYAHYESNGWKVGSNPVKSWQACCVKWNANNQSPQPKKQKML